MSFQSKSRMAARLIVCTAALLMVMPLNASETGTSFTGKWATAGKFLLNGEQQKGIIDIKQEGAKVTGTMQDLGGKFSVKGTVNGTHLELWGADWNDPKPFLTADLNDGVIRGSYWGASFTARPATPTDEIHPPAYIEPPALRPVPTNGLAKTPPMGWNSWNLFAERVDDQTVRTMADAMVSSGMKDAGYIYVNIDDTWEGTRDANGILSANKKFPDMKALADYVHSKGLKLGIYSSPGPRTCGGYPASYGHEQQDARMFAAWGIDFLKYDWCSAGTIYKSDKLQPVYQTMGDALYASGRPILFSLCEYGMGDVQKWGPEVGGNMWRTTGDIRDDWDSMMDNIHKQALTAPYAGPGHWNDPDMLEIGNGHMSDDEYRTHMSLWALTAAPLLAGNDIRTMSDTTRSILLNKEVIAVDQDPLGKQASPAKNGNLETWIKPLQNGDVAVGVVNLGKASANATVKAADLGLTGSVHSARDLWAHKDVKFKNGQYSASVPAHGVLLLRVSVH
jgi:alpha-galactosidase